MTDLTGFHMTRVHRVARVDEDASRAWFLVNLSGLRGLGFSIDNLSHTH